MGVTDDRSTKVGHYIAMLYTVNFRLVVQKHNIEFQIDQSHSAKLSGLPNMIGQFTFQHCVLVDNQLEIYGSCCSFKLSFTKFCCGTPETRELWKDSLWARLLLKTSRRLVNFEVSKSNCTSKTKLYLKNLANLNPRKHGFVPLLCMLSHYPGNKQNADRPKHQQTTIWLRCACAPRHNNYNDFSALLTGVDALVQIVGWIASLWNNGTTSKENWACLAVYQASETLNCSGSIFKVFQLHVH